MKSFFLRGIIGILGTFSCYECIAANFEEVDNPKSGASSFMRTVRKRERSRRALSEARDERSMPQEEIVQLIRREQIAMRRDLKVLSAKLDSLLVKIELVDDMVGGVSAKQDKILRRSKDRSGVFIDTKGMVERLQGAEGVQDGSENWLREIARLQHVMEGHLHLLTQQQAAVVNHCVHRYAQNQASVVVTSTSDLQAVVQEGKDNEGETWI